MTDVVVVGGGVIGCSIAYHLAREATTVTVIERAMPASPPAASWASAGGLRAQGRHAADRPLALEAASRWRTLERELDADLAVSLGGHLHVAESADEASVVEARVRADRAGGLAIELVEGARLREIAPVLARTAVAGAWTAGDGQADPVLVTRAFAAAARRGGVRFLAGEARPSVDATGAVVGVVTSDGERLASAKVVLATGAWSAALLADLGLGLPLRWRALQMLRSAPAPFRCAPTLTAVGRNLSLKQSPDATILVGGRWFGVGTGAIPRAAPDIASGARQWDGATALVPALQRLAVVARWAGVEAQTLDGLPLIGPSDVEGLYLATGFSNHGFQISPAVGRLVAADLIAPGAVALAPFRPQRFAPAPPGWPAFRDEPTVA